MGSLVVRQLLSVVQGSRTILNVHPSNNPTRPHPSSICQMHAIEHVEDFVFTYHHIHLCPMFAINTFLSPVAVYADVCCRDEHPNILLHRTTSHTTDTPTSCPHLYTLVPPGGGKRPFPRRTDNPVALSVLLWCKLVTAPGIK